MDFESNTWVWDGTTWTKQHPVTSPPSRIDVLTAYDAGHQQVIMFGGFYPAYDDTWLWDGNNWTLQNPANSPPARCCGGMAYDAARKQVVLFGGTDSNFNVFDDTWVWDGTNWTEQFPAVSPPANFSFAMAYDAAHKQVVLFGGCTAAACETNATWLWDGTNWSQENPANSPGIRGFAGMAYDAAQNQTVLFGGLSYELEEVYDDTWTWDGTNWTQQNPAVHPGYQYDSHMAYDVANKDMVFLESCCNATGGNLDSTWLWEETLPQISAIPASVSFGNVVIGKTKKEVVAVANGATKAAISDISLTVTQGNPADFSVHRFCESNLEPGHECTIAVHFTPDTAAAGAATLNISTSGGNLQVPLTAAGVEKQ
jgi:hypothetical protein